MPIINTGYPRLGRKPGMEPLAGISGQGEGKGILEKTL